MNNNSILNCNFSNYISTEGAAIYLSYPGNITIKGCLFVENFAAQGVQSIFFKKVIFK